MCLIILICAFVFLSFFPLPYTICLDVLVLKRILSILSLKSPTFLVIGSGIRLINQSYQVFYFLHFFLFKLIHIIYRYNNWFKNSSCTSLLIFTFLSFNYLSFNLIKSFSNSKRLFFTFKNWFFRILFKYFLSIL